MTDEPTDDDARVTRALAQLDSAPRSEIGWHDVALIARRRRRIRFGALGAVVVAAAIVAVVVPRDAPSRHHSVAESPLPSGAVEDGSHIGSAVELVADLGRLGSADPAAVSSVAAAEQDFTTALLRQAAGNRAENVSVSPASLALALSMLQNGARGRTATEIAHALSSDGLSAQTQDAGWAGLTSAWTSAAKAAGIEFSSANSLWLQRGLPMRAQFMAALARYYASGVWQVDFAHHMPAALAALNEWTSQHTHGRITKLFDQLDPSTLLALANAVYFHAAWQTPFESAETEPGPFVLADGSPANAMFMTSNVSFPTVVTSDYQAAQLSYQGGRFAALAIMPTRGALTDFTASLTGAKLAEMAGSLTSSQTVKLPRFTTTSDIDLDPVLKALGIRTAYTNGADFSAMSSVPLHVGDAIQRVYLRVGEKGTEAAAVTGVGMTSGARVFNPEVVTFDHPFLFLIRDTKTGAVLFASEIYRPSS